MFKKNSIAGRQFLVSLSILIVVFVPLASFWVYQSHKQFLSDTEQIRAEYIKEQKEDIQHEVARTIDFIRYKKSQTEERVRDQIETQVYQAHAIAASIYNQFKNQKSSAEIKSIVREALRPIRFNKGRGYYFATGLTGIEELFADRPELEGKDLSHMKDTKGKFVIQDMIRIAKDPGEGFYAYTWTKPSVQGRDFPKIAFVKYFEPFDWFIGTGEYLDDMEKEIQGEVLERISKIRFGTDGYVFVFRNDGTFLSHIDEQYIGKNLIDITDPKGAKINRELLKSANEPDGGFVHYVWNKPSIGKETAKLGYAKAFPDWQWVVGTGIYLDDVERAIAERLAALRTQVTKQLIYIITMFAACLFITFAALQFFSKRIQKGIDAFIDFFRKSAISYEKIDENRLPFSEFKTLAHYSNKMVDDRTRAEEILKNREASLRSIFSAAPVGIGLTKDRVIQKVNDQICRMLGYTEEELLGQNARVVYGSDEEFERVGRVKYAQIREKGTGTTETRWKRKDGRMIDVLLSSTPMNPDDLSEGVTFTALDITERLAAEEEKKKTQTQLQQYQKLEAVGTLAGGIAHDFNNLLSVVQGNISLMLCDIDPSHPHFENLKSIEQQVRSGARLTSQLLGYARRGRYAVKVVSLNQLVRDTSATFGRTRKDITIHLNLTRGACPIHADQGQMEQILLNLYVNAADAMPRGGSLFLETSCVTHENMQGKLYQPHPGRYVLLTVRDTGSGMDAETKARVFDPFFTTKEMGRGTGLGLASTYGIVKSHKGYIDVESEPGRGATFSIYLPASEDAVVSDVPKDEAKNTRAATILVVDDEQSVLQVATKVLERLGHKVWQADDGEKALEIYKENKGHIDLVVLDMIMPGMGGGDLYDRLKQLDPQISTLLSSGYSIEGQAREILSRGCNGFIQKPFTMNELSREISRILETE